MSRAGKPPADHWRRDLQELQSGRWPVPTDCVALFTFLKLRARHGVTPELKEDDLMRGLRLSRPEFLVARATLRAFRMLTWTQGRRGIRYTLYPPDRWGYLCLS